MVRSTKVPIALLALIPTIRSPFPVAGDGPVVGLGGAFADQDHVADLRPRRPPRLAPVPTDRAAGAEVFVQVSAQVPAALDEQGLVDRLVRHVHLRPVRERPGQVITDLLRGPVPHQPQLDLQRKLDPVKLPGLRAPRSNTALLLRRVRPVVPASCSVPAELATDRRWCPAEGFRDRAHAGAAEAQVRDLQPLFLTQVPVGAGLVGERIPSAGCFDLAVSLTSVHADSITGRRPPETLSQ